MTSTFFDTHAYVKRLEASGVPADQAEAHAQALTDAMQTELVKMTDLNEFRAEVKGQFELLKWMLGFLLAGVASTVFKIFQ